MRPVLLAGSHGNRPLVFTPAPGTVADTSDGLSTVTITASDPVVWNWSVVSGAVSGSNVVNGGTAKSITFSLGAGKAERRSQISLSSGLNSWTIQLNALATV